MQDSTEIVMSLKDYLSLGTDIFNIVIIIAFFIITYLADKRARFNERRSVWYKELIIQPHLEKINDFFTHIYELIETNRQLISEQSEAGDIFNSKDKLIKRLIENSNNLLTNFRRDFIDIVYSMNEDFAQDLFLFLSELQDELNQRIEKLSMNANISFEDIIRTKRIMLFNKLFNNSYLNPEKFFKFKKKSKK